MEKNNIINFIFLLLIVFIFSCKNNKKHTYKALVLDTIIIKDKFVDGKVKDTFSINNNLNTLEKKNNNNTIKNNTEKTKINDKENITKDVDDKWKLINLSSTNCVDSLLNDVNIFKLDTYIVESGKFMTLLKIHNKNIDNLFDYLINERYFVLNKNHTQYMLVNPITENTMVGYVKRDINKYVPCSIKEVYSTGNSGVYDQSVYNRDSNVRNKYFTSSFTNFITGKGIKLGMLESLFKKKFTNCPFLKVKINNNTNLYIIDGFDKKYYKKYHINNEEALDFESGLYFARYAFVNDKLIEFSFGLHYP